MNFDYSKLAIDQIFEVMRNTTKAHGVEFFAEPNFGSFKSPDSSEIFTFSDESNADLSLIEVDQFLTPNDPPTGTVVLLFEAYYCIDEIQYANKHSQPPVITDPNTSSFVLNEKCNVPLSVYLLAFDRTVEKLKQLALKNEFHEGRCISSAWLTRSLNTLSGVEHTPNQKFSDAMSV